MSAPAIAREVRYRAAGSTDETAWVYQRFPVGMTLALRGLPRGASMEGQIRNVAANGRVSAWVSLGTFTVGTSNRVGAAALPNVANQQSMWNVDTSVTFAASSTSGGVSTATISVTAGTLVIGSRTVSYGASSTTISGTAGQQVTVYLYYDDPYLLGGTLPLGLTTNIVDSANDDGRVAISALKFTYPAAGGSSSGGGGIGGGGGSSGACPAVDSWVLERSRGLIRARQVLVGDWLLGRDGGWVEVTYSATKRAPAVIIETATGHRLTCSLDAPILTVAGAFVLAAVLQGESVDILGAGVEPITRVTDLGDIEVQHISCAGAWSERVFMVGDDPDFLFPHHNLKAVP